MQTNTFLTSAGLAAVTQAGPLGPYFAIKYFLPAYDPNIDPYVKGGVGPHTSSTPISSSVLLSDTNDSVFNSTEVFFNIPDVDAYKLSNPYGSGDSRNNSNFIYYYSGMANVATPTTAGATLVNTNPIQTNQSFPVGINTYKGKPLSNIVSAADVGLYNSSSIDSGILSASSPRFSQLKYTLTNPLSSTSYFHSVGKSYMYRVSSYSPSIDNSNNVTAGKYKCRIDVSNGNYKFNKLYLYASKVNQIGVDDTSTTPVLLAVVVLSTPIVKSSSTLNNTTTDYLATATEIEINAEIRFRQGDTQGNLVYLNSDYWTRVPTTTTNSTSGALAFDGDVSIGVSALPLVSQNGTNGDYEFVSWYPKAKLQLTDTEKQQLILAHDPYRFTALRTLRVRHPSGSTQVPEGAGYAMDRAVLNIDTSCPDDALIQIGYNCAASGIKSIAMGCYTSALGYYESTYEHDLGGVNSVITADNIELYVAGSGSTGMGGYTFSHGIESVSRGLTTYAIGWKTSADAFASFAGGCESIAGKFGTIDSSSSLYNSKNGINFAYGKNVSAFDAWAPSFSDSGYSTTTNEFYGANVALNIRTLAGGGGSLAGGVDTSALGKGSFSFGVGSVAYKESSLAIGTDVIANGFGSVAFGIETLSRSILTEAGSFAAGYKTSAIGGGTFAAGSLSRAIGQEAFAFGYAASAISNDSYSIGQSTLANGSGAFALGNKTISTGSNSFGFGLLSSATGNNSFVFGQGSKSTGINSYVLGYASEANKQGSYAIGTDAISNYIHSIAIGKGSRTTKDYEITIGSSSYTSILLSADEITIGNDSSTTRIYGTTIIDSLLTNSGKKGWAIFVPRNLKSNKQVELDGACYSYTDLNNSDDVYFKKIFGARFNTNAFQQYTLLDLSPVDGPSTDNTNDLYDDPTALKTSYSYSLNDTDSCEVQINFTTPIGYGETKRLYCYNIIRCADMGKRNDLNMVVMHNGTKIFKTSLNNNVRASSWYYDVPQANAKNNYNYNTDKGWFLFMNFGIEVNINESGEYSVSPFHFFPRTKSDDAFIPNVTVSRGMANDPNEYGASSYSYVTDFTYLKVFSTNKKKKIEYRTYLLPTYDEYFYGSTVTGLENTTTYSLMRSAFISSTGMSVSDSTIFTKY